MSGYTNNPSGKVRPKTAAETMRDFKKHGDAADRKAAKQASKPPKKTK